ncbi:hypothetical protein O181_067825 [Austropuccinia psidii MF-1]|uniref:Uncharacterized protein n=1 Tax=Austropuccinia psidii MF-1 TaxID=1389203 RepID=A0A9Q3EZU2_9BASI|nr:hypothetical protein [Austropuccinia psidii MF-1]
MKVWSLFSRQYLGPLTLQANNKYWGPSPIWYATKGSIRCTWSTFWQATGMLIRATLGGTRLPFGLPEEDALAVFGTIAPVIWNGAWEGTMRSHRQATSPTVFGFPVLWGSRRQGVVALSTRAAKYVSLSYSTQHLFQALAHLEDLGLKVKAMILCNNEESVNVSLNNELRKRTQYLNWVFFFVNDLIMKHGIAMSWTPISKRLANIFTKQLSGPQMTLYRRLLGLEYQLVPSCEGV